MSNVILQRSILLNQMFSSETEHPAKLLNIMSRLTTDCYYRSYEMGVVTDPQAAFSIRHLVERDGLRVVSWMTNVLDNEKLSLSCSDRTRREKSVERILDLAGRIADTGAASMAMMSGADPGDALRAEEMRCFRDSMFRIAERAASFGMTTLVELFDRFAHKKRLLGPTDEAVAFVLELQRAGCPIYLAWDSAHVALNGEDLVGSIRMSEPCIAQAHLANAVLDPASPLYGDHHMPCGGEGCLNEESAARIVEALLNLNPPKLKNLYVAVEVHTDTLEDGWIQERGARKVLDAAFKKALKGDVDA